MAQYWIVGGEFKATDFTDLAPGGREQPFGPYGSYVEAKKAWARVSWSKVDHCHVRYFIVKRENAEGPLLQPAPA